MSYREINVNGRVYQYSIGRNYTTIRGLGAFPNQSIGDLVRGMTDPRTDRYKFIVTPRCVANTIKGVHDSIQLCQHPSGKIVKYEPAPSSP
jgi:hypothetical protein